MAIAFDAAAQSGQATNSQTVFSFSHTLGAGANRVVVVGIAGRQGGTGFNPTAPTYGGVSMTSVWEEDRNVSNGRAVAIYIIKETLTTGANTVAWTATSADTVSYGLIAASFTGVDQTAPTSGATGNNGGDTTPTLTITSATDSMVLTINYIGSDPATATLTCDGTERIRNVVTSPDTHSRCVCQTKPGAASVVMAPTQAGTTTWIEAGMSLKDAPEFGNVSAVFNVTP